MLIAVIGGTGMVGTEVVRHLTDDGHEVRILSRRPPESLPTGSAHHPIDLRSREGLDAALGGVEAVVDVANERKAAQEVMVEGTRDLLERCRNASIDHYVGISIIGCERFKMKYYAAKAAQEEVIRSAPIGWSLLKAPQFHELLDQLFTASAKVRISPVASIPLQPIAAGVAARELARIATGKPRRQTDTIAGPKVQTLTALSKAWRQADGRFAVPLPVWVPGRSGRELRAGALTDPSAAEPGPTFGEWLAQRN